MESDMNMDWPNLARYRLENKKLDVNLTIKIEWFLWAIP